MEILGQPAAEDSDRLAVQLRHRDGRIGHTRPQRTEVAEAQLARRQSEFLAGMADELRAPIDSVLNLAKLLADNEGRNLTAQQVDFAQAIYAAGTRVLALVDDIRDLAEVEAEPQPAISAQPLDQLRLHLLRSFRQSAREKRIAFDVILAPGLPSALHSDGRRLRHLLRQFVAQAFAACQGGSLVLSMAAAASNVAFSIAAGNDVVMGMRQGLGRGLAICRRLAQSLGGEVYVEDGPDGAVRMVVELPQFPHFQAATPAASGSLLLQEGLRGHRSRRAEEPVMLIVEGNVQVASVMLDLVRANGYQGVVASDLGTMRVLLREVAPEGILIGGSLLDIDGWSTLELLKRDPHTRRVPINLSYFDSRRYLCLQLGARSDWNDGGAERMLAQLDAAAGGRAGRLLLAGVAAMTPGLGQCMDGRDVKRVDSGAAAVAEWGTSGCDALVIGPALEDMSALDLVRSIGAAGQDSGDLPLAMIEGPAAPLAVTLEVGMLRHRARLEDVLGETALYLARSVGGAPTAGRGTTSRRSAAAPELAGRTALVIDDDIYNVYAVTGALEQQGMTAVLAENVREGLEALHAHPEIEVVLIDITMPEVDGDSAIHALRATHERPLPIIAMTLRAMPGDRAKCIGAGASDYVSKPVNVGQLLGLLRTWLVPLR